LLNDPYVDGNFEDSLLYVSVLEMLDATCRQRVGGQFDTVFRWP